MPQIYNNVVPNLAMSPTVQTLSGGDTIQTTNLGVARITTPSASRPNLFTAGDFESGVAGWQHKIYGVGDTLGNPTLFVPGAPTPDTTIAAASPGYVSAGAMQLTIGPSGYLDAWYINAFAVTPNTVYEARAWAKFAGSTASPLLISTVLQVSGATVTNSISGRDFLASPVTGTTQGQWVPIGGTMPTQPSENYMQVGFENGGGDAPGTVYLIDRISVTQQYRINNVLLTPGDYVGQVFVLSNEGDYDIIFDFDTISYVADGRAGSTITTPGIDNGCPAHSQRRFVWNGSRWYGSR